jgi:PPM family protein phosphatase
MQRSSSWTVGARSETGYIRSENEDRMSRVPFHGGFVYIVSDGMGGHNAGAKAAEVTVRTLERHLSAIDGVASIEATLKTAFAAANANVYELGHAGDEKTAGMGATAVVCVTAGASALVAHVGDSRAYLYQGGRLARLTKDHTRAQGMVDAGVLSPMEAEQHPESSVLSRAIGQLSTVEVEIGAWQTLTRGDEILLCSDGLFGEARDAEIEELLGRDDPPQLLADHLIGLALSNGGGDNVTVQILRYGSRPVPFAWAPFRYQLATLPFLMLACAAPAYLANEHLQSVLSQEMRMLAAENRALRQSSEERMAKTDKELEVLEGELASLNSKITAAPEAPVAPVVAKPATPAKKKPRAKESPAAPSPAELGSPKEVTAPQEAP